MNGRLMRKPALLVAAGLGAGLLIGVGMMIGTLCGVSLSGNQGGEIPETLLYAEAATRADTMAAATGAIDDSIEGLYTLDFITGELKCFVMYTRPVGNNKFGGHFNANVVQVLGAPEKGKTPSYLLLTGRAAFPGGATGTMRPAYSVAYVVDANTGKFAAFGLPWNTTMAASGRQPQQGQLRVLDVGNARSIAIQE
jgi:hypothetical protein